MRPLLMWLLIVGFGCSGCFGHRGKDKPRGAPIVNGKPILTPETALSGRVVRVNPGGRFVVLNFPIGRMPAVEQRLNVYRLGLKTGEIRISGPQYDDNIVADVITGEVQLGDEVRDR